MWGLTAELLVLGSGTAGAGVRTCSAVHSKTRQADEFTTAPQHVHATSPAAQRTTVECIPTVSIVTCHDPLDLALLLGSAVLLLVLHLGIPTRWTDPATG